MCFFDSHCHLNLIKDINIIKLLNFLEIKKFKYILSVSININDFLYMYNNYFSNKIIYFSCGIHPNNINLLNKYELYNIEKFIIYKKVIAVGETGLDYKNNISKNIQQFYFNYHLYLSNKYSKPTIIHSRLSYKDTFNMIKNFDLNNFGAVIHCFNYNNKYELYKFLNLGLYISLSGLITFKNILYFNDLIKYIPIDRLLVETDSPFLCPEPYRGKINIPYNIIFIIKTISIIKRINFNKLCSYLLNNFLTLFKI